MCDRKIDFSDVVVTLTFKQVFQYLKPLCLQFQCKWKGFLKPARIYGLPKMYKSREANSTPPFRRIVLGRTVTKLL